MITLVRYYTPMGTWGELQGPGGFSCMTMENPWQGNQRSVSCIPEGVYTMRMRRSPMVERTSRGEYLEGWEITNVPGRTHIMVHPGNFVRNTDGCLLVGKDLAVSPQDGLMVTSSQETFRGFMEALKGQDEWQIDVRQWTPQFP